ncbi:MAG: Na+/H+ antiporter subunit G [Bacteroidales bacterium]|nr:Na+/H+ antiporter subunit G [Bacteroidales bacterium]
METLSIIGACITLIGSLFLFLGSLGLVRMPDLYNRIQSGTKASTLGTLLTLFGIALIYPNWSGKLVILIVFVIITNPVSSHVISRAAHRSGISLSKNSVQDDLSHDNQQQQEPNAIKP